ncbi:MAG TPA: DUF3800 domain-containing protein [Pyrinomonadaceae bacterium]|jgi:hypothetical protein
MKKPKDCHSYFFVDESGDPTFYDARGNLIVGAERGSSPLLIIGFVETQDPHALRRAVLDVQQEVLTEPYFKRIPSLRKTAVAFHAKDDAPEIRYLFYRRIKELEFKAQFIVARKIEKVFRNDFRADEDQFYDHLVSRAFRDVLHRYKQNSIYFAKRGSRDRQEPLLQAILKAKKTFEQTHNKGIDTVITVQAQSPKGEPCLSIIDYVNWALQRAYTKKEMRYYEYIEEKVSFVLDLYDWEAFPGNCYYRSSRGKKVEGNRFDISKATPL